MLHLSLGMYLTAPAPDEAGLPDGPLFHRWLPNGIDDAISFAFGTPKDTLQVWFLRRGYMDDGFVRYAPDRFEVDEIMMQRHGWLNAGALRGQATYSQISASEMAAVRADSRGAPEYMYLGKRVVEFLRTPIQGLLDTLRLQYGQYWLRELQPWDSRNASLGGYCQGTFHLKWRESDADEWSPFLPDDPVQIVRSEIGPGRHYAEFLTEKDWRHIQDTTAAVPQHPLAMRVAGRAHELSELGHIAEAYVQAVTALELALEQFMSSRATVQGKQAKAALAAFAEQPLSQQLQIVALASNLVPQDTVEAALRGIFTRNKIGHEASIPTHPSTQDLLELRRCTHLLLGLPDFKSPRLTSGNQLFPPDENAG